MMVDPMMAKIEMARRYEDVAAGMQAARGGAAASGPLGLTSAA